MFGFGVENSLLLVVHTSSSHIYYLHVHILLKFYFPPTVPSLLPISTSLFNRVFPEVNYYLELTYVL